jgi:hypothetical protein
MTRSGHREMRPSEISVGEMALYVSGVRASADAPEREVVGDGPPRAPSRLAAIGKDVRRNTVYSIDPFPRQDAHAALGQVQLDFRQIGEQPLGFQSESRSVALLTYRLAESDVGHACIATAMISCNRAVSPNVLWATLKLCATEL